VIKHKTEKGRKKAERKNIGSHKKTKKPKEEARVKHNMKENKISLADLRNEIKVKTSRKTTLEEDKASTASQLKKGEKQLEALNQYLKDLDQPCVAGDSTYEDRKSARASEISSLQEALVVLENAFKPKEFLARD
jgi:chromosome segregation ATPase